MASRIAFSTAAEAALAERENGRDELCRQILATAPDARWKIDPSVYSRLSPEQLRRVLADTAGDVALPVPTGPERRSRDGSEEADVRPYREPGTLRRIWRGCPVGLRAVVIGVIGAALADIGIIALPPMLAHVRSPAPVAMDVRRWPACPRLDRQVDACVYMVQDRLRWADAGDALGMPIEALRPVNKHLPATDPLARGTALVVWRYQLPLER